MMMMMMMTLSKNHFLGSEIHQFLDEDINRLILNVNRLHRSYQYIIDGECWGMLGTCVLCCLVVGSWSTYVGSSRLIRYKPENMLRTTLAGTESVCIIL